MSRRQSEREEKDLIMNCTEDENKTNEPFDEVTGCQTFLDHSDNMQDFRVDRRGSKVVCLEHDYQAVDMYCITCNFPVCLMCTKEKHNQHECEQLTIMAKRKRFELYKRFDVVKGERLNKLKNSLEKVAQNQINYNQRLEQVIMEIKIKAEEMKEEIDKIRDKLIDEVKEKSSDDQLKLKKLSKQIEKEIKQIQQLLQENEERLAEADDLDIINIIFHFDQIVLQDIPMPIVTTRHPPVFINSQVHQKNFRDLYGSLMHSSDRRQSSMASVGEDGQPIIPEVKADIISSFTCDEYIHAIHTVDPNTAWMVTRVGIWGTKLHLYNKDGKQIKSISTNCYIEDMATTPSGDILATEAGIYVKKIYQNGKVEDFADVSPYKACGIHATKHGDVIVTLKHGSSQPGMIKKGRIMKLTMEGNILQVIDNKNVKFNKYTSKIHVVENINQDIWVMEEFNQCIVVLDKNGKYKFTYKGPEEYEMSEEFIPYDIAHDHRGNILVADCHNQAIHLVNKRGRFLQYILLEQDRLYHPSSVTVDSEGKLWVGCNCGQVFVMKYQILY
ncbi:hypothetical protein KUTeg_022610 [Tegillarca granosa]|uniref:B box-type domain-containing protein n=1 Tax=Tegillarca granosa TaxID=220873 RepID=A0ABQ9E974_TEGGR|nr:hypothetical protein KUTeg_022610 [Tegillarca granosa]